MVRYWTWNKYVFVSKYVPWAGAWVIFDDCMIQENLNLSGTISGWKMFFVIINIMATNFLELATTLKNGDQLLGIGYHFNILRSQVATRKKLILCPVF